MAFLILTALMFRYGKQIKKNLLGLSRREQLRWGGVFLVFFSTIFFAFDAVELGTVSVLIGAALLVSGFFVRQTAPQRD